MPIDRLAFETSGDDEACMFAAILYDKQGYREALARITRYIREAQSQDQRREWQRVARELANLCAADPHCANKQHTVVN